MWNIKYKIINILYIDDTKLYYSSKNDNLKINICKLYLKTVKSLKNFQYIIIQVYNLDTVLRWIGSYLDIEDEWLIDLQ